MTNSDVHGTTNIEKFYHKQIKEMPRHIADLLGVVALCRVDCAITLKGSIEENKGAARRWTPAPYGVTAEGRHAWQPRYIAKGIGAA